MSQSITGALEARQLGISFARLLRDGCRCGAVFVDQPSGNIALAGEAAALLGLSLDPEKECAFGTLPASLQAAALDTLASGKPLAGRRIEFTDAHCDVHRVRLDAIPVPRTGRTSAAMLVLSDGVPVAELEKRLRQLERLANLGTLAAGLAHEIKNALVAVKTFSDLLLEQNRDAELSNLVSREIGRIDSIVGRMLRCSGPARPAASPFSLHETLEHALRLVQPRLEGKSIALRRSFEAVADKVEGDDTQMQQAFINLFLNALEAMEPKGTLTVATLGLPLDAPVAALQDSAQKRRICVTVQDTGAGIPPEALPRLFEPFYTTKRNGTGLGLLITRRIIQEHQGDISVQSRPGAGTAFRITLPALAVAGT